MGLSSDPSSLLESVALHITSCREVCSPFMKVNSRASSLFLSFVLPYSYISVQIPLLYLSSPSLDDYVVEGLWYLSRWRVLCSYCQVSTPGAQSMCMFSAWILGFVWRVVNFKFFMIPWWIKYSPWSWEACSWEERHTHTHTRKQYT